MKLARFAAATAVIILVVAIGGWLALPKPPLLEGIEFSTSIRDREGQLLRVTLTPDQKYRLWAPLDAISPALIAATVQYEDKHFARHPGVNPIALLRSTVRFVSSARPPGASTITMQLARLRFHLHTRSLAGKLQQLVRALELERHYTKREILEAYLNLAPYGRNIEGAAAASEIYFGKPAARLSKPEAIALTVIPQSPSRRALFVGRENPAQTRAQARWSARANRADDNELSLVNFTAEARPWSGMSAPHFVRQVLTRKDGRGNIDTTLDLATQRMLEQRINSYIAENRQRGVHNAAAMLVDFRSMEVLAQAGSARFADKSIHGQVDGTQRPRSPGSTLKPFVYALALEQGRIHPLTTLKDAPRSFGEYNPENYDREFLGPIRASDALARSRNVPAVALASELSHPTLYEFVRSADVELPRDPSFYGLSLPLGGGEIRMEDLVRLYAALANNGELRPLRRIVGDRRSPAARRLLTPEAAFLTLEMLGQIPRPGLTTTEASDGTRVFWKTGTSHGFRDAWSIAVFDRYVLAVWVGNFDGRGNPFFVGRKCAAPLMFSMIDALRSTRATAAEQHLAPSGANLKRIEFCSVSGGLPTASCPHRTESWFIPGISPLTTCDVHREIMVEATTGLRVARDDGSAAIVREVYEFWPSDLLTLFDLAGVPRRLPPPYSPQVEDQVLDRSGRGPRIVSPQNSVAALSDAAAQSGIPLRAETETGVRRLYWFADKSFLGGCDARDVLAWKPAPGVYQLTALDDHGRSTSKMVSFR